MEVMDLTLLNVEKGDEPSSSSAGLVFQMGHLRQPDVLQTASAHPELLFVLCSTSPSAPRGDWPDNIRTLNTTLGDAELGVVLLQVALETITQAQSQSGAGSGGVFVNLPRAKPSPHLARHIYWCAYVVLNHVALARGCAAAPDWRAGVKLGPSANFDSLAPKTALLSPQAEDRTGPLVAFRPPERRQRNTEGAASVQARARTQVERIIAGPCKCCSSGGCCYPETACNHGECHKVLIELVVGQGKIEVLEEDIRRVAPHGFANVRVLCCCALRAPLFCCMIVA